ncbi:hypothetical protein ANN_05018, partial [Periplaneta americana]
VHQGESDLKDVSVELQAIKKPKLDVGSEPYSGYLYPVTEPGNHILWYESWARMSASAFRPWPSLLPKESKGLPPVIRESLPTSVPAYLSHSPPVLLHPERVVPMSESERFERSFQPNVALAPIPQQQRSRLEVKTEDLGAEVDKKSVCSKKSGAASPVSPDSAVPVPEAHQITATTPPASTATTALGGPALYNPEIELSTDTEDSSSDVVGEVAPVRTESKNVMEQVVVALDACEGKEETKARVVELVQRLALRLQREEAQCHRLRSENEELQRLHHEQEERIAELQRRLHQEVDSPIKQDPDALQDKMAAMEKELRTLRCEVASLPVARRAREPSRSSGGGSPVSVITSPTPATATIVKSEPIGSE